MDKASEIMTLVETEGLNAPDMTQGLKNIGGGSMQNGINVIAQYFQEDGEQKGEQKGLIEGSLAALVVTLAIKAGHHLYIKYQGQKKKNAHEEEGEKILNAIKSTVPVEEMKETPAPQTTEKNPNNVEEE